MRTALNFSLGLLLLFVAGCGSIDTRWEGNHRAFVGTQFDVDQVTHYAHESELVAAIDIPFSFVVDIFCLPYDLAVEEKEPPKNLVSVPPPSENPRDKELKQGLERAQASK